MPDEIRFFPTPTDFRNWLGRNHEKTRELWVGFYRKRSGRASITWPEAVDEALCVGWIDGLRKAIDTESYKIRFTPRRATSNWSAVNVRRVQELIRLSRMRPGGLKAFSERKQEKTAKYSYENRKSAVLDKTFEKLFRARRRAWSFFQKQPASYRQTCIWWIASAKKTETQEGRLERLIETSEAGRRLY